MSENEIIREYEVSNTTARRALRELEQDGWVKRIKGKGTVVLTDHLGRSVDRIISFTRNMLEAGRTPSTRLLSVELREEGHKVDVNNRLCRMKGPLYELQRLRLADDVPVMSQTHYVSAGLCPNLDKRDLEDSLYDIYENDYGLTVGRVDQIVRATVVEHPALMQVLSLERPTPAFFVEGVTYYSGDIILEMEESLYRGDQYEFSVSATQ